MLQIFTVSAMCSLEIFPHVIARNPHLYLCWRPLANRLRNLIWKPKATFTIEPYFKVTLPQLKEQIDLLVESAQEKGIIFPPQEILRQFE